MILSSVTKIHEGQEFEIHRVKEQETKMPGKGKTGYVSCAD